MKHYAARIRYIHFAALIALAASFPGGLQGQGVSSFDAADETVIFGPDVPMPAGIANGTWAEDDGRFVATAMDVGRSSFYFPNAETARLRDGFVRARFDVGKRLDGSIMLRTSFEGENLDGISGYGFSIEKKGVRFYRWDNGTVNTLTEFARVKDLRKRTAIEIVIWMIGPHMSASLFDAETLEPLATLMTTDAQYTEGRIGLRAHERQDDKAGLTLLSVRPAGLETGAKPTPIGSFRFVGLTSEQHRGLSRDLSKNLDKVVERDDGTVLYKTNGRGVERLRREGVEPALVQDSYNASFYYLDRDYRNARGKAPKHTEHGYDITASYKDPDMVQALIEAYHKRYPKITQLVEIGRTLQDRPILALKISDNPDEDENEPAILLNAAHHGDEMLSTEFAIDAMAYLLEHYRDGGEVRRWVKSLEIWVVPLVNPDGLAIHIDKTTFAGRKNGRDTYDIGTYNSEDGVDLNRNYPFQHGGLGEKGSQSNPRSSYYRGPKPGSEPEIQAMMRLFDTLRFASSLSYHTTGTIILAPYTIDDVVNPDPNEAWTVAEEMAAFTPVQPNGRTFEVKRKLYSVDGTDQDWFRFAHGTLALLLEGSYQNPDKPETRTQTVETTRPSWMYLLNRYLDGPTLFGNVTDDNGDPLVAEIRIKEITMNAGERWMTRCRDGRFDRQLAAPGKYTVQAIIGDQTLEKQVTVKTGGRKKVSFTFPVEAREIWTLEEALCPVPDMCAVDTLCALRAGQCPTIGPARYCRVGNTCFDADAPSEDGCGVCKPALDHFSLAASPASQLCGEAGCRGGERFGASTCDGAGACVASEPETCAPYAGCASDGACAVQCTSQGDCIEGYLCREGACAEPARAEAPADANTAREPAHSGGGEGSSGCSISRSHQPSAAQMLAVAFVGMVWLTRRRA